MTNCEGTPAELNEARATLEENSKESRRAEECPKERQRDPESNDVKLACQTETPTYPNRGFRACLADVATCNCTCGCSRKGAWTLQKQYKSQVLQAPFLCNEPTTEHTYMGHRHHGHCRSTNDRIIKEQNLKSLTYIGQHDLERLESNDILPLLHNEAQNPVHPRVHQEPRLHQSFHTQNSRWACRYEQFELPERPQFWHAVPQIIEIYVRTGFPLT